VKSFIDNKNIGMNFVGGSVTTFLGLNPSFYQYDVDAETLLPLNYKSYFFNITAANLGNPNWTYLHDYLEEYDIPDLSPDSLY
jgi:hypothetical protein